MGVQVVSTAYAQYLAAQDEVWPVLPRHIFDKLSARCQEKCQSKILGIARGRRLRTKAPIISDGVRHKFARFGQSWEESTNDFGHGSSDEGEETENDDSKHAV